MGLLQEEWNLQISMYNKKLGDDSGDIRSSNAPSEVWTGK